MLGFVDGIFQLIAQRQEFSRSLAQARRACEQGYENMHEVDSLEVTGMPGGFPIAGQQYAYGEESKFTVSNEVEDTSFEVSHHEAMDHHNITVRHENEDGGEKLASMAGKTSSLGRALSPMEIYARRTAEGRGGWLNGCLGLSLTLRQSR